MKIISSGFVIVSHRGQVLLGKVDNHPPPYQWTVFKGQQEHDESLMETAIRELKEETGIDVAADHRLNRNISTNHVFRYSLSHKDVYLFRLDDKEMALDNFEFKCDSITDITGRPEIADYEWVNVENLRDRIFPSQRGVADFLNSKYEKL